MARESTGMTQREVIPHIPEWLGWEQPTLAKIEKGRRVIAFEEVQVLAGIYGTDLATIDAQMNAYRAALANPVISEPIKVPSTSRPTVPVKPRVRKRRQFVPRGTRGRGGGGRSGG